MASDGDAPWGQGTPWKTQAEFFTFLRGGLRRVWNKHPSKLNALKKQRIQVKNPNPRGNKATVWGASCAMCGKHYISKEIQVDHINSAGQLNKVEDIQGFVERLLLVSEKDLRLVCKPCNSALAYADKYGTTYKEAVLIKQAIDICKMPAQKQRDWLEDKGIVPATTAPKRRKQVEDYLLKGEN